VCKPLTVTEPVHVPACSPAEISKGPDTTNRGDNEGIVIFAESGSTATSTEKQQHVNTGGDEHKVQSSGSVSMFPPQPTIEHGVPLKESNSSNEGEASNGEEPEQDRSPKSKHEGTCTKKPGPTAETECVSSAPAAETECVSSASTATELSDTKDDSANRGEKDNKFALSSDRDKREAIREIESTLEDAYDNAVFVKKQSPAWYDRFECKQCKQSEKGADCCYLKWQNKEGKNASKDPSERAMNSILPTVGDIAKGVTNSLTWCTHHGCLNGYTGKCNKQCASNKIYMAQSPAHGAMLIAGACKRPGTSWSPEMTRSETELYHQEKANSEKEFYKEYRCCSKQDSRGNDDSSKKCCYELYQSGKGLNIQHHLETSIASVTRDAMNPAFEAAKAAIEAGSNSEEKSC